MPQFLLSPMDIEDGRFILRGPEAFHVTRVLRRRQGDSIELFDGAGGRYTGVIDKVGSNGSVEGVLTGERSERKNAGRENTIRLSLYLGLLKASHWEWALEKGTELGVSAFIPVITPRTVVRNRQEASASKQDRWRKIVLAAAKQSGRCDLPELKAPAHFRDAIGTACKDSLTFLAWEKKPTASTYEGLRESLRKARAHRIGGLSVSLFIGPEGGYSDEEVELAECQGATLISLGPNILRAETAALAATAIVLHELRAA